jgi:protein gp37
MSDLFHDAVPDAFIAHVWAVMAAAEQHTFQVLTKRHGRMRSLLRTVDFWRTVSYRLEDMGLDGVDSIDPPSNVWLGVSVENQQWADIRIPALLDTPAAVRFLSCEPLLGPVDLDTQPWRPIGRDLPRIDWVIVGGESGREARPMHSDWARSLRDQCTAAGVAFHFKQFGDRSLWVDRHGDVWEFGADGLMHTAETAPFPREHVERKWGPLKSLSKKAAGRVLDGRTWDQYPGGIVDA